jgi:hypothetical protein
MCKNAAVALFDVLSRVLLDGQRRTTTNLSEDSRCPGHNMNPRLSEYETGVITIPLCVRWVGVLNLLKASTADESWDTAY